MYDTKQPEMKVGEKYQVETYFHAYDFEDKPIQFQVLDLYDTSNQKVDTVLDEDKKTLVFQTSGIYEMDLLTKDSTNRKKIYHFRIPVER